MAKQGMNPYIDRQEASQDLSAGALNFTTSFDSAIRVLAVYVHAGANITETIKISFNSKTGANYDTLIEQYGTVAEADYWSNEQYILEYGDEVTVTCTNATAATTIYVTVLGEKI